MNLDLNSDSLISSALLSSMPTKFSSSLDSEEELIETKKRKSRVQYTLGSDNETFSVLEEDYLTEDEDSGKDEADAALEEISLEDLDERAGKSVMFGNEFEKADEYDSYLNEPNPWSDSLQKPLRPSQVIGFHWMLDRHKYGGGLIADKVGTGKVCDLLFVANHRRIKPSTFSLR